jgi:streptogramin lyase
MTGGRFALIIATSEYEDADLRKLVAPAQDAEALARILKDPKIGSFETKILLNEPHYRINQEIELFCDDRHRDDLLLLYFSCHGIKDRDGQLYFASIDTRRRLLNSTAISSNFVNDIMRNSRSRQQVLLLDCCFSGAFARGMIAKSTDKQIHTADYFTLEEHGSQGRGRIVLTASDAMQYSFEGDKLKGVGERSLFTHILVQGLETGNADLDKNGRISYNELYDYTYENIKLITDLQRPEMWVFGIQGNIVIAQNQNTARSKRPHQAPLETPASIESKSISASLKSPTNNHQYYPTFKKFRNYKIHIIILSLVIVTAIIITIFAIPNSFYNRIPLAYAGGTKTVHPGEKVTLDGSKSVDPDGNIISYSWKQTGGPIVVLNNANIMTTSFTAPNITSDTSIAFSLTVKDNKGATGDPATIYIIVKPAQSSNSIIQNLGSEGNPALQQSSRIKVVGIGGVGMGEFDYPAGIAIDSSGSFYVADWKNDRIQKFNSDGQFIAMWGSNNPNGVNLDGPSDVAIDSSGNIYVTELFNNRIQKFNSDGQFIAMWGSKGTQPGQFNNPEGITIDSSGNAYIADAGNNRIQKFNSDGDIIRIWGVPGMNKGQFNNPVDVKVDHSNYVYVADAGNNRIQKFNSDGQFIAMWGSKGTQPGQFNNPYGITMDSFRNIYVADYGNDRIQKFNSDGQFIAMWGSKGTQPGQFNHPEDITIDSSGNAYVADSLNNRIQILMSLAS